MKHYLLWGSAVTCILISSCREASKQGKGGAIVLGDSSTIVTETDSQYLRDMVGDIEWAQPATTPPSALDTPKKEPKSAVGADNPAASVVKGFKIDCGSYTITIAGVEAKEYKKQDPLRASGLSYALTSGNIRNSKLVFSGNLKSLKIQQRYQSKLILDGSLGKVPLPDLGLFTADWSTVKVNSRAGNMEAGIEIPEKLQFARISNARLKNATDRSLRKSRAANKTIQAWLKAIKPVRNAGDEPTEIVLSNIQWQILGTDASGRPFNKTLRLDVL